MCGICGFYHSSRNISREIIRGMADSLEHRGPDDAGVWLSPENGLAFGHRRLSILDLSTLGAQPMHSENNRFTIAFNGEVYNHTLLRNELQTLGHSFRGHSDTEVMLAAFEEWGVCEATKRFLGMFAFSVWDAVKHRLWLVRDRLGVKPLYYGWHGSTFLWGSELKALAVHPDFKQDIDANALASYWRYGYVPTPWSMIRGIYKLPPGGYLMLESPQKASSFSPIAEDKKESPRLFWSLTDVFAKAEATHGLTGEREADTELERILLDAVRLRLVADVPVGALLSGGVDSSLIVAMMQEQSQKRVRTFTIGFAEDDFNEAAQARTVAKFLGTDHTEEFVDPVRAREIIPHLPVLYDEPLGDISQIPQCIVCQTARQNVTVCLSGDGGDEFFAGYERYRLAEKLTGIADMFPVGLRGGLAHAFASIPSSWWDVVLRLAGKKSGEAFRTPPDEPGKRFADILRAESNSHAYRVFCSLWQTPERLTQTGKEYRTPVLDCPTALSTLSPLRQMMGVDAIQYLPDNVLVKVDRASMGVGLEIRSPLLDHRIAEFSATLPSNMLQHDRQGKMPLRRLLAKRLPDELVLRPKRGFCVPLGAWLRGPLRDWAEELLCAERLSAGGLINPAPIRNRWERHCAGLVDGAYQLWPVLAFQAWRDTFGKTH